MRSVQNSIFPDVHEITFGDIYVDKDENPYFIESNVQESVLPIFFVIRDDIADLANQEHKKEQTND